MLIKIPFICRAPFVGKSKRPIKFNKLVYTATQRPIRQKNSLFSNFKLILLSATFIFPLFSNFLDKSEHSILNSDPFN